MIYIAIGLEIMFILLSVINAVTEFRECTIGTKVFSAFMTLIGINIVFAIVGGCLWLIRYGIMQTIGV